MWISDLISDSSEEVFGIEELNVVIKGRLWRSSHLQKWTPACSGWWCQLGDWLCTQGSRVLHLGVEVRSEELLRQLSYDIKSQLGHPKPAMLVLYDIRAPIIGPFRAWKPHIPPLWHKEPARSKQSTPPSRGLWMRRAGSLCHKRAGVAIPRI